MSASADVKGSGLGRLARRLFGRLGSSRAPAVVFLGGIFLGAFAGPAQGFLGMTVVVDPKNLVEAQKMFAQGAKQLTAVREQLAAAKNQLDEMRHLTRTLGLDQVHVGDQSVAELFANADGGVCSAASGLGRLTREGRGLVRGLAGLLSATGRTNAVQTCLGIGGSVIEAGRGTDGRTILGPRDDDSEVVAAVREDLGYGTTSGLTEAQIQDRRIRTAEETAIQALGLAIETQASAGTETASLVQALADEAETAGGETGTLRAQIAVLTKAQLATFEQLVLLREIAAAQLQLASANQLAEQDPNLLRGRARRIEDALSRDDARRNLRGDPNARDKDPFQ